ncbi:hypothetical protein, partial [Weissella cibaria]|uniref:hypothetical protein n=1 Tax=Weissella cibaria TaxID=137591 RepID=UPI001AD979C2
CCSAFGSKSIFKSVNPIKNSDIVIHVGISFRGYFGQTGCSWSVLFYFYTKKPKKVPTTNRVNEWSSAPNILKPFSVWFIYFEIIMI